MKKNLVYYSVNSFLSYKINEKYYNNIHYVWVAPYFNLDSNPASANPCEIFLSIIKAVVSKDAHSDYIERNKTGILNGAEQKLKAGIITSDQRNDIVSIVKVAEKIDFRPLVYIIPANKVGKLVEDIPPFEKAGFFSDELKISNLPKPYFDIIEFKSWI